MAWIAGLLCCCALRQCRSGSLGSSISAAGTGRLRCALALHCPGALIDAVDVNERALSLCRDNAVALGVAHRVRVLRPEEVEPETRYDEIWSNPRSASASRALHELLLRPGWSGWHPMA